ncbi:hypothetical protein F5Y13DRAFT_196292 [Hypoxylon sp. FL1857]|nr:hypothetical protein F5Y13DRAFT_196292 [Hypoxylon sp. FL1857]
MSDSESNDLADEENVEAIRAAIEDVTAIYKAGTPFFTKAAIQKLGEAIDASKRAALANNEVILRSLDGSDFDIYIIARSEERKMDVCRVFDDTRKEWESSEHHVQLQSLLASVEVPPSIEKIVAFALGPFASGSQNDTRGVIQHLLLMSVYKWVSASASGKIEPRCYAQDPSYSEQEKQILEAMGITVLDDPKGFLEADESSVVISISPNVPVRQIIADTSRPALIIWDQSRVYEGDPTTDPVSPRVIEMLSKEYTELEFPYHEDTGDFAMSPDLGAEDGTPAGDTSAKKTCWMPPWRARQSSRPEMTFGVEQGSSLYTAHIKESLQEIPELSTR